MSYGSKFILFSSFFYTWISDCSSKICLKEMEFFFDVCKKSVVYICVSLFLGSGFFPFVYLSIFMPIPYCLDYYNFTMSLIQVVNVQLCSPFTDLFWPSRYFVFPYEFHNQLVNIYQKSLLGFLL